MEGLILGAVCLYTVYGWRGKSLVSLLFLCMHAYIRSSGFVGGKGPRSLKNVILPDKERSVNLDFA